MSKRRIKGKEFIKDIKDGLTEEQLRGKYAISPQQLTKLLTQVVSQNLVSEEELRSRFFLEPVKQPTDTEKAEVAREGAAGVDVASRTFLRDFSFLFKKGNIGEGRQITSQTLTKARNSFLACFLILVVTGQSFRLFLEIAFYLGITRRRSRMAHQRCGGWDTWVKSSFYLSGICFVPFPWAATVAYHILLHLDSIFSPLSYPFYWAPFRDKS